MMSSKSLFLLLLSWATLTVLIHGIVPPKTPVISGFEPAAIGTNRELVCDAFQPGAGKITYKWYKYAPPDDHGSAWEQKGLIRTGQRYIFSPVSEKRVFHEGREQEQVSGKYLCRASNSAGTRDSDWGDLYVYTRCSLYTVSVSPAKPAVGSTFTLNCYIPNPSVFTVRWKKKADTSSPVHDAAIANSKGCRAPTNTRYSWSSCSPLSSSSKTKTFNLQVTNAQTGDSAYWICQDMGLSCKNSDPINVVVQGKPGTPQITGFPTGPVAAGAQVNLKCVASPLGNTYDWYKANTKLTTSISYDFQVKKESAGVYKCVSRNTAGSATSSDKTLVVYSKADTVVVTSEKTFCHTGETDRFTCKATGGYPTPTLKFYIKRSAGTPVEVTQGLDRVMVKEDNQAEYYCEAEVAGYPDFDTTSPRKTYNVTFPNTKVSFINNPTAAVQVRQLKKFTCETDESSPVTSIKWYQENGGSWQDVSSGIIPSERNGAYGGKIRTSQWSVTSTKAMNGRTVRCTSSYSLLEHGFINSTDTVMSVKWSATELKMVEKPNSPIIAGTSVNIKCETDSSNSGSPGTISWYRNGQQIATGDTPSTRSATDDAGTIYISQLTVTTRKEDNQATYECKLNDQANFKKDVTITVHFPPSGIQLSETSITVIEGESKTILCITTSSSNPVVSGVSLKKKLGSTEVDVTGTSRVTDGVYYGKGVSIDIKLDTNRLDNGAQYICYFTYGSTTFTETATVNVQFNPSKITMIQKTDAAIHEGQPITIVCETDSANPAADIQFQRKRTGENLVKQTTGITSEDRNAPHYNGMIRKSTLTVTSNRLDNQAVFECKVQGSTFQVNQTTTVTVYYPPTVKMLSNPTPVKEGEILALTCEASGGNPDSYTYSWYYNNLKQSETSKVYTIAGIKYTQSGKYKCEAANYSPGGKAEDLTEIDVLYKAKWNPALPELYTVASKTNEPVEFVLHVIANPPPTTVIWFYQNGTKIGESFTAIKVNDKTYTLNKTSVTIKDYGNYTVNVTNHVGNSSFVFELQRAGPPYPPCCLKMINKTAVSVYLTFKSNFSGGSDQTFTIVQSPEGSRRKRSVWVKAAVKIPDPGFEKDVVHKVKGLTNGTTYQFRVKAVNADGSSGYNDPGNGNFLKVTTNAAPNANLDVTRKDNTVTVSWGLERKYSKIRIKYCPVKGGGPCLFHDVESPAKQGSTKFDVNNEQTYKYSLVVFDGDDKVFTSAQEQPPPPTTNPAVIGGGAGAGILLFLIIIAVIVAVVFIKKRRAEKGNGKLVTGRSNTAEGTINVGFNDPDDIDGGMNPYADSGMNPYADSDMNPYADSFEMAASPSSKIQVEGALGSTYAVVNKGNKKPLLGGKGKKKDATPSGSQAYAEVDFSKKKKGKGKKKPETGEAGAAYAEVDFSKKKKGAAPSTPTGPDGAVYAQVNKKPPVVDEYAQVDFTKKASKMDAAPDTPSDVYAVVNKPMKPDKLPEPGTSDDQAVYANVNGMAEGNVDGMAEDDVYEDVRDDALIKEGYKQPKTAYQVGVDGTIYSEVRIKPPKNPDVIIGKETIEDPYGSVDFTKEAPSLPEPEDPDDPNDPGFMILL